MLYANLKFDFLRDTVPVAGIIRVPMVVLVHPSLEVADVPALIAYANANPGQINMAPAGRQCAAYGRRIVLRDGGRDHDPCALSWPEPAAFGRLVAGETETWAKVVRFAGLKVD